MTQKIITSKDNYKELKEWFITNGCKRVMLVCGNSIEHQKSLYEFIKCIPELLQTEIKEFRDFKPNPLYENVLAGVESFRENNCDSIIAVGGGSALDVAKCIKAYSLLDGDGSNGEFLKHPVEENDIPFLAVPTTAGTGSEATRFAVIYLDGVKKSVAGDGILPGTVLLDSETLTSLPIYQKKSAMLDALCHAIESYWSVKSTDESKEYSRLAIKAIVEFKDAYLNNTVEGREKMLMAANNAGKAINITQTTAGHAMCYKITGLFGVAHGHATALCNRVLYPWMIENLDKCIDSRGREYLRKTLDEIGVLLGGKDAETGAEIFNALFNETELEVPAASEEQFAVLRDSVDPQRLSNFPVALNKDTIEKLYRKILLGEK
jgi:alcohol dehydrogenase class IV